MAQTGNSPEELTVLRLQARKSFSLGLWIQDQNGNPLDITGAQIRMVVRKRVSSTVADDSGNLITSSIAQLLAPTIGYAKFNIQASELNQTPGEYMFTIVSSINGYTTSMVNGVIDLEQNTEFTSIGETYVAPEQAPVSLEVTVRDMVTINVRTGPSLAPGEAVFTQDMADKLLQLFGAAVAAGQTLTADNIADGVAKVVMTMAERNKLANLTLNWSDIQGKPIMGDVISHNASDFLTPGNVKASDITSEVLNSARVPKVSEHRGFVVGTTGPSGGSDGDLYGRYS